MQNAENQIMALIDVRNSEENPVEEQLGSLGLSLGSIDGKVLDIGAGPNAALVNHLRKNGKSAVALDTRFNSGTHYGAKAGHYAQGQSDGSLPFRDGSFDLVVAHFFPVLYGGFSGIFDAFREELETEGGTPSPAFTEFEQRIRKQADFYIREALRLVDKEKGKIVVYPSLPMLQQKLGEHIVQSGFLLRHEEGGVGYLPTPRNDPATYRTFDSFLQRLFYAADYRTILEPFQSPKGTWSEVRPEQRR